MDVDKMQKKLAIWAERDPDHRFYDLYNLLYDEDWLYRAYRSVKTNSGSTTAGVDGLKMFDFEEDLEANLRALRQDLKSEAFVPKPVRRTYQGCHYTAIAFGKRCKDEGVRPSMEQ